MTEENKKVPLKRDKSKTKCWEKDRRARLNSTFEVLATMLPQFDSTKPFSKIEILQRTILFIEDLRKERKKLLSGLDVDRLNYQEKLESAIEILRSRNEQLKEVLRKAEITVPEFNAKNSWVKNIKLHKKVEKIKLNEKKKLSTVDKSTETQNLDKNRTSDTTKDIISNNNPKTVTTSCTTNSYLNPINIVTTAVKVISLIPVKVTSTSSLNTTYSTISTPIMATGVFVPITIEKSKSKNIKIRPKIIEMPGKVVIKPLKNSTFVDKSKPKAKKRKLNEKKPAENIKIESKTEQHNLENETKELPKRSPLQIAASEFSTDIFNNLHVHEPSSSSGNPESLSPTAAYLMNFPLVSTKIIEDETNNENESAIQNNAAVSVVSEVNQSQSNCYNTTTTKKSEIETNEIILASNYHSSYFQQPAQTSDNMYNIDALAQSDKTEVNNHESKKLEISCNKNEVHKPATIIAAENQHTKLNLQKNIFIDGESNLYLKNDTKSSIFSKTPIFTFSLASASSSTPITSISTSAVGTAPVFDALLQPSNRDLEFKSNNSFCNDLKSSLSTTPFTFSLSYPTSTVSNIQSNIIPSTPSKPTFSNFTFPPTPTSSLNNYTLPFENSYNTNHSSSYCQSDTSTQFTFSLTTSNFNSKYTYAPTNNFNNNSFNHQHFPLSHEDDNCRKPEKFDPKIRPISKTKSSQNNNLFSNKSSSTVKYPHVNWMTSPQLKQTPDFTILPPFDFIPSTVTSAATYYPPPPPISNIDLAKKSDIFFAHPPGDENFHWSPNKIPNVLDTNHYIGAAPPTTLPNLHGDLALGTTPTITTSLNFENKTQNTNNFFSVSQLVENQTNDDHLNPSSMKNCSKETAPLSRYNRSKQSKLTTSWNPSYDPILQQSNDENYFTIPPPIFHPPHPPPPTLPSAASSNLSQYVNHKSNSHNIYSAESLIGTKKDSTSQKYENNCFPSMPSNDVSYYPLDFNTNDSNYNPFYSSNNTSNPFSTNNSLIEMNNCADSFSAKLDNCSKYQTSYTKIRHHHQQSTVTSSKLHNNKSTTDTYPPPTVIPPPVLPFSNYDNVNSSASAAYFSAGINSPMVTDDAFHLYHIPPSSSTGFQSQLPLNSSNHTTNSNTGGGSTLANFNLSTICPEINEKVRWG